MWLIHISLLLITFSRVYGEFSHDFEDGSEDVFHSESGVCSVMRPWIRGDYNLIGIPPPDSNSLQFAKPQTTFSCIFSDHFTMSRGGQLQLRVYMSLTSTLDLIRLLVYQNDIVVGEFTSSLDHSNFDNDDWNIFNITIDGSDTSDGFVAITGRATTNSHILVDHIQYLPPSPDSEGSGDSDEDNNSAPVDGDSSEEDDGVPENCIEYDFSESFNILFATTFAPCANIDEYWEISEDGEGTFAIKPRVDNTLSCVTSSPFPLRSSGTLNIKVRIETESYYDLISAGINDEEGELHFAHYGRLVNGNFSSDSYVLEIPLEIKEEYGAQVTFIGLATSEAKVLVEHFQFMPVLWDQQPCTSLIQTRRYVEEAN